MGALRRHAITIVVAAAAAVVIVWLVRENHRLEARLAARPAASHPVAGTAAAEDDRTDDRAPTAGSPDRGLLARPSMARLGALARAIAGSKAPGDPDGGVDPDARRNRRQKWIKGMLGRSEGETEDQYRARVAPLVQMVLAPARSRLEQRRKDFEVAADVSDEQRQKLDAAFSDAYSELLAGANKSVASGDLTPYKKNPRGLLSFIGGTVGTVDSVDDRMRKILSPDQLKTMEQSDFDLVEYLAATAPWEKVNPPPVEKK